MEDKKLVPYEFARRRFRHACTVLMDEKRSLHERLLDAVVALTPLRAEDVPSSCQALYERTQELIGQELWARDAAAGSLSATIRGLSLQRASEAVQWIVLANDALEREQGVDSTFPVGWNTIRETLAHKPE